MGVVFHILFGGELKVLLFEFFFVFQLPPALASGQFW
jgi:hypothetical protein